MGSSEKDVHAESVFKAAGAEVVSDARSVRSGFVTVGAPLAKHLALSVMCLRAARLPGLTPTLAARLAGNWISVLLYRRCLASLRKALTLRSFCLCLEESVWNSPFSLP